MHIIKPLLSKTIFPRAGNQQKCGDTSACLSAIRFAVHQNQSFRIWTDSSFVVKRLKEALRKQGGSFDNQINNHDLLCEFSVALWEARAIFLGVNKVYSHQEIDQLDEAEQWVCRGNDFVDIVAKNAYTEYPIVLQVWNNLSKEISFLKEAKKWVHKIHVETGKLALTMQAKQKANVKEPWFDDDLQTEPRYVAWTFPETIPDTLPTFQVHDWSEIHSWIRSLHQTGNIYSLSWFQLAADLSFEKPGRGPWYHYNAKVWKSAACRPSSTFSKKTRWLSDFLLRLSKLLEQTLPTQFCRPDSYTIAFRTSCLTVRMERERFDRLENWLQSHRYIFHKPSDLNFLEEDWWRIFDFWLMIFTFVWSWVGPLTS